MKMALNELKSKLKLERLHFESSRVLFGLDIGTHSVKVAVLRETGNGTKLVNLGIEEVPQIKEEERESATIEAIKKGAHTGRIGDGKIFVVDLLRCIRIRTGEEGSEAIG